MSVSSLFVKKMRITDATLHSIYRGFRHGQLVVVINGGVRTCETYAALSVTVMLTRFPTLESILTSRSMMSL